MARTPEKKGSEKGLRPNPRAVSGFRFVVLGYSRPRKAYLRFLGLRIEGFGVLGFLVEGFWDSQV